MSRIGGQAIDGKLDKTESAPTQSLRQGTYNQAVHTMAERLLSPDVSRYLYGVEAFAASTQASPGFPFQRRRRCLHTQSHGRAVCKRRHSHEDLTGSPHTYDGIRNDRSLIRGGAAV